MSEEKISFVAVGRYSLFTIRNAEGKIVAQAMPKREAAKTFLLDALKMIESQEAAEATVNAGGK